MLKNSNTEFEKDLNLSHYTFENLPEAVYWVDSKGNILYVNESACKMSGYSKEELMSMKITNINSTELVADFKNFWKQLRHKKHFTYETKHRHKKGNIYDVEVTGNYIEYEGQEITCSIVRDIRKRKLEEEMLRTVSEATSGLTGEDFFTELARHITATLSMRYALITECANAQRTKLRYAM